MRHKGLWRIGILVWLLVGAVAGGHAFGQVGTSAVAGEVRDQQAAAVPGAVVTIVHSATGAERAMTTDRTGTYRFLGLMPGTYRLKIDIQGFAPASRDRVVAAVDMTTRVEPIVLTVAGVNEVVDVQASTVAGAVGAALGNVIEGRQIVALPLEARNPAGLMSLQPGAVSLPTGDPRSGAVSGARSDQSNVTLDGVDVNDPELGLAYTAVLRMPLDAIDQFRVTTTNYGPEMGRSSGGQISLVTKAGGNVFHGSGYGLIRNTATSTNEYFLELAQRQAGQPSVPPKLDKQIYGAALGGPAKRNRLFFYANYEALRESSESPAYRRVASATLRDGIVIYQCADPAACPGGTVRGLTGATHAVRHGYYGLSPAESAAIDPLGLGPSLALAQYWQKYPQANDPGADGLNYMGYRFAAPVSNRFNTFVGRTDATISANHRLFGRINLMRDNLEAAPQFPGQSPSSTDRVRNWGFAAGHEWVIGQTKMNTFRYGFTKIQNDAAGQLNSDWAGFEVDPFVAPTPTYGRSAPTHNITDDFSWVVGGHTLKVGANLRFTRTSRYNNLNSYSVAASQYGNVFGAGTTYMPGSMTCTTPGCAAVPAVAEADASNYGKAFFQSLGIMSQSWTTYYADRSANIQPLGVPVRRRFATDEYEFYAGDSWRLSSALTLSAGVRWSLYSPPWETNGLQTTATVNLGDWFDQRAANAAKGIPASAMPTFQYDLSGSANGKAGFYDWDYTNLAPRVSAAWTPEAAGGWLKTLTGDRRLVVRGGYSVVYDRVGSALVGSYDGIAATTRSSFSTGALGVATPVSVPFGTVSESTPGIRFVGPNATPPMLQPAPAISFPYQPPTEAGTIGVGTDASIRTPYAHAINAVIGRDLPRGFSVEAAYVGRFGRRLLVRRDMAVPANLVDRKSGTDYYTAAQALVRATQAKGIGANAPAEAYAVLASSPYWENLFPDAAGGGFTATQSIAMLYNTAYDYTSALMMLDKYCYPACSIFGPYAYVSPQFDGLTVQSSIGRANYNALQLSVRKRWSQGYQFDVNYTWSKSEDLASSVERADPWLPQGMGGTSGLLANPWQPERQWGPSDFDVRHQLNVNAVADLPFGRGRRWGGDASRVVDAFIGNWQVAGLLRLTSGFPFNVANCETCWATNWIVNGNAELSAPGVLPQTAVTKSGSDGYPNAFADSTAALAYFRQDLPGEVGIRNQLRGDGYFTIDLSVAKAWQLPRGSLRFRWDTFNLTNAVRFDTATVTTFPENRTTFGRYSSTLATCDGRAGRCMQFGLSYEF